MTSEQSLLPLVDLLYEAAHGSEPWTAFLTALADALKAQSAALLTHDLRTLGTVAYTARMDPAVPELYNGRFHSSDAFAASLRARSRPDRYGVFTGEMLVPRSTLRRTEFFNDFAVPLDITQNHDDPPGIGDRRA